MCEKFKSLNKALFLFVFFIACGSKEERSQEKTVKVILRAIVRENDKFQLFYVDSINGQFNERDVIRVNVEGSNDLQSIVFELPEKIFPKELRIDIGENKIESAIEFNSLKIVFGSQKLVINNATFNRFFNYNVYIEQSSDGIYLRKKLKQEYDPFFSSTDFFTKHLELKF